MAIKTINMKTIEIFLVKTQFSEDDEEILMAFDNKKHALKYLSDYSYYITPYLRPEKDSTEFEYGVTLPNGKRSNKVWIETINTSLSFEDYIEINEINTNDFRGNVILMG